MRLNIKVDNLFAAWNLNSRNNIKKSSYKCGQNLSFTAQRSDNEKAFAKYKSNLSRKIHANIIKCEISDWNFILNSTNKNKINKQKCFNKYIKLVSDKNIFDNIQSFFNNGIKDKPLKRAVDNLMQLYKANIEFPNLKKQLAHEQANIEQKAASYVGKIDGKEYTEAELYKILRESYGVNDDLYAKAYAAEYINKPEFIAKDIVNLVKHRNEYAVKRGYSNYYSYLLKEQNINEDELYDLLDKTIAKTKPIYNEIADKINIQTNEVEQVNNQIKNTTIMENIPIDMYKNMGWDVEKMPIKFDLYPQKNKQPLNCCVEINPSKSAGILCNLTNDYESAKTFTHELGHSVYWLNLPAKLQYLDKTHYNSMTEGFAMMMGSLLAKEGVIAKYFNLPEKISNALEIENLKNSIQLIHSSALFMDFERKMYQNPDKDLAKLWAQLSNKYLQYPIPEKPTNAWASVSHFLSFPAYYQNYFRAEIMQNQIYNAAHKELGNLTENKNTSKFFEQKLFKYGISLPENEILKKITGTSINADTLCESYKKLIKYYKK